MRRILTFAAAIAAIALAAPPRAGAQITTSFVQVPANETFVGPDLDGAEVLPVVGVAGPSGNVDIRCIRKNGQAQSSDYLGPGSVNVPLIGNTFSTGIRAKFLDYERCRLVAVPTGSAPPYNPNAFGGPIVSVAGHQRYTFPSGVNAGALYDYYQAQSAVEGYWSVYAAGDEMLNSSYAIDPDTLDYADSLWSMKIRQQSTASAPTLQIGGRSAVLSGEADNASFNVPGFQPIQNLQQSIDEAAGGVMRVSESEVVMFCDPTPASCTALIDAGVRLDQTTVSRDLGHTLELSQRWVNTTNADLALDITYAVGVSPTLAGWLVPAEGTWKAHAAGDMIPQPLSSGPGSLLARVSATDDCATVRTACGSLTWYRAPDEVRWDSNRQVWLTYHATIPANGSIALPFTYSQGFPQSQVQGFAATAEEGYRTAITVGEVTRNRKTGTATIAVDVPGAGVVHAEGPDLKTIDLAAPGAGTVSVSVEAIGKTKKKLRRKGKVNVEATLSYTRAGLDPTSRTVPITLKRKRG